MNSNNDFLSYCLSKHFVEPDKEEILSEDVLTLCRKYASFFLKMVVLEGFDYVDDEDDRYTVLDHCLAAGAFIASNMNRTDDLYDIELLLQTDDPKMLLFLDNRISNDSVEFYSTLLETHLNEFLEQKKSEKLEQTLSICMAGTVMIGILLFAD